MSSKPCILVIGFMGAGKSTVAALLGERLGFSVIEMDTLIAQRSGYPTVAALIDAQGEPAFRTRETEVAKEIAGRADCVVSAGGGLVTREENMEGFRQAGAVVVLLSCSFETLERRISADSNPSNVRPLFRDKERARSLFAQRQALYEKWATITVDTERLSPLEVVDTIVSRLT